jgi:hypothetical protein
LKTRELYNERPASRNAEVVVAVFSMICKSVLHTRVIFAPWVSEVRTASRTITISFKVKLDEHFGLESSIDHLLAFTVCEKTREMHKRHDSVAGISNRERRIETLRHDPSAQFLSV